MYKDQCEQDGDCDHCLSDDCKATFSQASKFYQREEAACAARYGRESVKAYYLREQKNGTYDKFGRRLK